MPVDSIEAPVDSFTTRSSDGLRLRVHTIGTGPHRWLLPPGMGTPLLCWKHIFESFHEQMTIVTWDQRGTYGSDRPRHLSDLAFERHLEDALSVLEALDWPQGERFVTGSWSMGVQLGLAIYERIPEQIGGLTLIAGFCEHVLRDALGPAITTPLTRALLHWGVATSPVLTPLLRPFVRDGWAGKAMDGLNISTANKDFVVAVTSEVAKVELDIYLQNALEFDKCSTRHVLQHVDIPTLIVGGRRDLVSPPRVTRELHSLISGSDYVEVEHGTHYTSLEYPELVNEALERFFRTRVFPETWKV